METPSKLTKDGPVPDPLATNYLRKQMKTNGLISSITLNKTRPMHHSVMPASTGFNLYTNQIVG